MTKQPNATVEGVARDLGMLSSALHRWIRASKEKGDLAFSGHGKIALTAEQTKIQRLLKKNDLLREEREILKSPKAFFGAERLPKKVVEVCFCGSAKPTTLDLRRR